MKSQVIKRSIVIAGHKTSVSLEDAFWKGLKEVAGKRGMTLSELVAEATPSSSWPKAPICSFRGDCHPRRISAATNRGGPLAAYDP